MDAVLGWKWVAVRPWTWLFEHATLDLGKRRRDLGKGTEGRALRGRAMWGFLVWRYRIKIGGTACL